MLKSVGFLAAILVLTGCGKLSTIPQEPKTTPEAFLAAQHWITVHLGDAQVVISQPTSSIIVYFVGLFTILVGFRFYQHRNNQQSKLWWAIGLFLTGFGALLAGTSYQAFGYEIKCHGREFCTYTSWWEVHYMLLSALGMNAFLIASAYSSTRGFFRKSIMLYAVIHSIVYSALLMYGAFVPVQFLVSFELLMLSSAPAVVFVLGLHTNAFRISHDAMNRKLRNTWLVFLLVGIAYGTWLALGLTQPLWNHGIWFTENDVLHVGMIGWVYFLLKRLPKLLRDL